MLTALKTMFSRLLSMSFGQLQIIFLNTLYSLFSKGMYFFGFYLVFMFDRSASKEVNISMVLIIGFLLWVWSTISETLKDYMVRNVTPYKGALWRFAFDARYIFLVAGMFFIFNLKYNEKQVWIYLAIIIVSQLLAKLCVARKLVLFDKDWKEYESERRK